ELELLAVGEVDAAGELGQPQRDRLAVRRAGDGRVRRRGRWRATGRPGVEGTPGVRPALLAGGQVGTQDVEEDVVAAARTIGDPDRYRGAGDGRVRARCEGDRGGPATEGHRAGDERHQQLASQAH